MYRTLVLMAAAASAFAAVAASRMELADGEMWSYAVVASERAAADPAWRAVADALAAKYAKPPFSSSLMVASPTNAVSALRSAAPRYVAFVVMPGEAQAETVSAIHAMMKSLDDDPYYDAVWGIVSGPSADAAMHVAASGPVHPRTALTTTGVDFRPYDDATTISDAYVPGAGREEYERPNCPVAIVEKRCGGDVATRIVRGDTTAEFERAWNALDPELLVTSAHASQRNLEMPFSTGNIVSYRGGLWTLPDATLINYATGQATEYAASMAECGILAAPKRDKLWIAAGNCLIGDYKGDTSMASALIGYGRVVQFMGYLKTTWFGEIGWETLAQFAERGATVAEAWYFAGQNLERKRMKTPPESGFLCRGRDWDRDATVLWGDPALEACLDADRAALRARLTAKREGGGVLLTLEALDDLDAGEDKVEEIHVRHPFGVVLPRAVAPYAVESPGALQVAAGDDFALVTSWPAMKKGETICAHLRVPADDVTADYLPGGRAARGRK